MPNIETASQATFDDLFRDSIRHELDAIVAGKPLANRVRSLLDRTILWSMRNGTAGQTSKQDVAELRDALTNLLNEYDRNTCVHEETHRAGFIWTICDSCGRKWADDRGGFKPHVEHRAVAKARTLLYPEVEK